ncbi:hypothetical protein OWV82_020667 [Melia azedarach]|uniref:Uncharacterized protein n=1 Tax=Melia azedarach TaxID=155640 RepID=A0ACC1X7H4_MELAZ|nr:hypothetical protein OWV82_020667 [Melia azedarach]
MAKVSSVYEGRIVNRGEGGEEDEEAGRSRMARQDAKARIRNFRTNLRPRPVNEKKIITRSVASTSLDKQIKVKENQQYVNKVKEKEKGKQKVQEVTVVEDDDEEEKEGED